MKPLKITTKTVHYWRSYVHSQVVVFWYQIKASVHVTARTEICADPHTPILVLVTHPRIVEKSLLEDADEAEAGDVAAVEVEVAAFKESTISKFNI